MLKAAAIAEKPFLDTRAAASIDLGLSTFCFTYYYYSILLMRSTANLRSQCIETCQKMLQLLDHLVSDSEEVYNGIVWVLICCPFTPYLILFREILAKANGHSSVGEKKRALAAMEHLPTFLSKMSLRNSLAAKLEGIATTIIQHARSIISRLGEFINPRIDEIERVRSLILIPSVVEGDANPQHRDTTQGAESNVKQPNKDIDEDASANRGRSPEVAIMTWDLNDLSYYAELTAGADSWEWTNDSFVDSMLDSLMWDRQPSLA